MNEQKRNTIEVNRILESIKGKIDARLIKLTVDVVMKTKWSQETEKELYKKNIERIPQRAIDAVLLGSHVGQIYQVSLGFAKKLEIELKPIQKNMLKEMIFFLVTIRTEMTHNSTLKSQKQEQTT